jgi:hypothetical protein
MEVIAMTGEQKQRIQDMRLQGTAFSQIADELGLSVNTIKSFCRRNSIEACDASNDTGNEDNKDTCKQCGKKLKQTANSRAKMFCNDRCRYAWWNTNRHQPNRKGSQRLTCTCCGREFISYGNPSRKYCGHACYIKDRFGEVAAL